MVDNCLIVYCITDYSLDVLNIHGKEKSRVLISLISGE